MNLSFLQFNEDNISTRITTGVLNHQFLRRPYKEHFYKFKDFLPLAKEFHSAPEYGELQLTKLSKFEYPFSYILIFFAAF